MSRDTGTVTTGLEYCAGGRDSDEMNDSMKSSDQGHARTWMAPRLVALTAAGVSEGGSLKGTIEDYMVYLPGPMATFSGYGPS